MESKPLTLTEACAPVLLYLTTFRRNAGTSSMSIQELQAALKREIDGVRTRCEEERRLHPLFERVFYALVATADQVILGSTWPQRAGWSMNLLETHYFGRAEGGTVFYRLADEILSDPTDAAAEMAELLFTCMGLGFQGELLGERAELERRRRQMFEKARLAGSLGERLAPETYGRNSRKDMTKLPTVRTVRLVAVSVVALVFAFLLGDFVTKNKIKEDRETIEDIRGDLDDGQ